MALGMELSLKPGFLDLQLILWATKFPLISSLYTWSVSHFLLLKLGTDPHPLSQLIPTCPSKEAFVSSFSHKETVSEVKELTQGSTSRDLSNSKARHLPSTAHSSAVEPSASVFLLPLLRSWGGRRAVMGGRGECFHLLYICLVCFFKNMNIYSICLSSCSWTLTPASPWENFTNHRI